VGDDIAPGGFRHLIMGATGDSTRCQFSVALLCLLDRVLFLDRVIGSRLFIDTLPKSLREGDPLSER